MLEPGGVSGCLDTGDLTGCLATDGLAGCLGTGETGDLGTEGELLVVWVSSKDWRFCNTGLTYNKKQNST